MVTRRGRRGAGFTAGASHHETTALAAVAGMLPGTAPRCFPYPVQSLQVKQRALLQQLDSLDREHEELQARLGEAEEEKARLAEQLEESREQSGQQLRAQQELLDALRGEKLTLEQSVSELQANICRLEEQARELKEREKLLVFFPELHIPAETQFESTGSLTEDMEKQLQANSIRMGVLEQENVRLRAALAKVKSAAEQGVLKVRSGCHQGEGRTCPWGAAYPKTTPWPRVLSHFLWGPVPCLGTLVEKAPWSKRPWGSSQCPLRVTSFFPNLCRAGLHFHWDIGLV
uniref:Uncharacterized protein n=1 Tax=Calidris pygmaea TaxID=425635 RepID=A0A8C3JQV8_9CHAR